MCQGTVLLHVVQFTHRRTACCIKYEIHLTSLSCLFSSFFFSAALRFSSSFSHCLCSSAAFISAWKVAFCIVFGQLQCATYPTKQCGGPHRNSLISYQLFLFLLSLEFFDFLPPLSALTSTGLHGFRERKRGEYSLWYKQSLYSMWRFR